MNTEPQGCGRSRCGRKSARLLRQIEVLPASSSACQHARPEGDKLTVPAFHPPRPRCATQPSLRRPPWQRDTNSPTSSRAGRFRPLHSPSVNGFAANPVPQSLERPPPEQIPSQGGDDGKISSRSATKARTFGLPWRLSGQSAVITDRSTWNSGRTGTSVPRLT